MPQSNITIDPWLVVDDNYDPKNFKETIFALSNGYMGVKDAPEELLFCASDKPATYSALIYELFNQVHTWSRGNFSDHMAKMINCPNWTGIRPSIKGHALDALTSDKREYKRVLDLRTGIVTKSFVWYDVNGNQTRIATTRFISQADQHIGAIRYELTPLNYMGVVDIEIGLDAHVAPFLFWNEVDKGDTENILHLTTQTKCSQQTFAAAALVTIRCDGSKIPLTVQPKSTSLGIGQIYSIDAEQGKTYIIDKIAGVCTSRDLDDSNNNCTQRAIDAVKMAVASGFDGLLRNHTAIWEKIWQKNDVVIEGDDASQQGIRFSIFQLHQAYSGRDPRLNIGARSLTGEIHNGHYFWDSEIYMVPFFIYNDPEKAASLIRYRQRNLDKAKIQAKSYGFDGAMYPWATLDGEENDPCWEYTQLEIHINVAVPYAVWQYVATTGDNEFLAKTGAELVIETCRFWASRVYFNPRKKAYVINGVTGPDEYCILINNNTYTNVMVEWAMGYGAHVISNLKKNNPAAFRKLEQSTKLKPAELVKWRTIAKNMFVPFDKQLNIHPQDDSFLDREPVDVRKIPQSERPIYAKWPWERVMRTQVVKQPDVLLLMLLQSHKYTQKVKQNNYDFYETRTIMESSLSPCIHSIIANEIGYAKPAFDYYLRSSRLDLDNPHTSGICIANAAGSWMSIVNGFAGMRYSGDVLSFSPHLPKKWKSLAFQLMFLGRRIGVSIDRKNIVFSLIGEDLVIVVNGKKVKLTNKQKTVVALG